MWLQRGRVPCGREARLQAGVRRKERDRIFNCLLRAERESKVEVGCPQCHAFCSKAVATKSPQTGLPTRDQMPEPMGGHSHSIPTVSLDVTMDDVSDKPRILRVCSSARDSPEASLL